ALLIDLWDELELPEEIQTCWTPAITHATSGKTVDIFNFAFSRSPGPDSTENAQIRGYEPLPPRRPEAHPHPKRQVDPVNGHPWG
ncbi:MAG: hypothetical protein ACRDTJ_28460, partial [Pseudonocardiaceae bacterium]